MNVGLTTSFIIAGILMLSILSMNTSISHSSTELTLDQITQRKANTISEILKHDISNIGYKENDAIDHSIKDAKEDKIEFESDIDRDGTVETITWHYTTTASNSKNPNDYVLVRDVDGQQTTFKSGVTDFEFIYLDKNRNEISQNLISSLLDDNQSERDKIRYIKVNYTVQSESPTGGANNIKKDYPETTTQLQFTPINLRL